MNQDNVIIQDLFKKNPGKKLKIFYDSNPKNKYEAGHRVCMSVKSTGQMLRFSETEALDILVDLSKALKWKADQSDPRQRARSGANRWNSHADRI